MTIWIGLLRCLCCLSWCCWFEVVVAVFFGFVLFVAAVLFVVVGVSVNGGDAYWFGSDFIVVGIWLSGMSMVEFFFDGVFFGGFVAFGAVFVLCCLGWWFVVCRFLVVLWVLCWEIVVWIDLDWFIRVFVGCECGVRVGVGWLGIGWD